MTALLSDTMIHRDIMLRLAFSPPHSPADQPALISPTNSEDEIEAITTLVSLPSFGSDSPPSSPLAAAQRALISPTNSADEIEAIVALISLPSLGSDSPPPSPLARQPLTFNSTYRFCFPAASPSFTAESSASARHRHPSFSSTFTVSTVDSSYYGTDHHAGPWYTGSTSLALPEDDDVLSPLHCFMRKYCVEAFSATPQDVEIPRYGKSHNGKIVVGQVGIRCLHCQHLNYNNRSERSVCYPSSLRNIYHSMETWQRRHAQVCTELPNWVRREMTVLMKSSRCNAGGRRQYWEDAAKQLGLVDTPRAGVRFARPPGAISGDDERMIAEKQKPSNFLPPPQPATTTIPIVTPNDKLLVTDYLYLLMDQMQVCYFTQEDRTGGRSKVKQIENNFPGMQCQHCCGKAGFGRYFPSSSAALALANSDRNIYNHLLKCRKCPESIQLQLKAYRSGGNNGENSKNKRGFRKIFFARVWDRIHNRK